MVQFKTLCIGTALATALLFTTASAGMVGSYVSYAAAGNEITFTCTGTQRIKLYVCQPAMVRVSYSSAGTFAYTGDFRNENFLTKTFPAVSFTVSDAGTYIRIQTAQMTVRVQKSPLRIYYYDAGDATWVGGEGASLGIDDAGTVKLRLQKAAAEHLYGWGDAYGVFKEGMKVDKTGLRVASVVGGGWGGMGASSPFIYSTGGYSMLVFLDDGAAMSNTTAANIDFEGNCGGVLSYYFIKGSWKEGMIGLYAATAPMPRLRKNFYGVQKTLWNHDMSERPWSYYQNWIDQHRSGHFPIDIGIMDVMYPWGDIGYSPGDGNTMGYPQNTASYPGLLALSPYYTSRGLIWGAQVGPGGYRANNTVLNANPYVRVAVDRGFDIAWYDAYGSHEDHRLRYNLWLQGHSGDSSKVWVRYGWTSWLTHMFPNGGHTGDDLGNLTIPGILERYLCGWVLDATDMGDCYDWGIIGHSLKVPISHHNAGAAGGNKILAGTEPWNCAGAPDIQNIYRKWEHLHERLVPYFFSYGTKASLGREAPLWRHMVTLEPNNAASYNKDWQYVVGDYILAAPYLPNGNPADCQGGNRNNIWLPSGVWYDYWNGTRYQGVTTVNGYVCDVGGASNRTMPIFIKAGAIIPMMPEMDFVGQIPENPITLDIWPSGQSTFDLYEDHTPVMTPLSCDANSSRIIVSAGAFRKSLYSDSTRKYILQLHCVSSPVSVTRDNNIPIAVTPTKAAFDAANAGWFFDAANGGILYVKPNGVAQNGVVTTVWYTVGIRSEVIDLRSAIEITPSARGAMVRLSIARADKYQLILVNPKGVSVTIGNFTKEGQYDIPLQLKAPGIYFVWLKAQGRSVIKKIVKL